MRADELQIGDTFTIELRRVPTAARPRWADSDGRTPEVQLVWSNGTSRSGARSPTDEVELRPMGRDKGTPLIARAIRTSDLERLRSHPGPLVCWLVETRDRSDRMTVQCHSFAPADGLAGDHGLTEIGFDDMVADRVRALDATHPGRAPDVGRWLADEFLLQPERRLVYHSGPGEDPTTVPTAFTMFGRRWVADVALRDGRAVIQRMTNLAQRRGGDRKRLAPTRLYFVDATRQTLLRHKLQAQLEGLSQQGRSYLALWNDFNAIERAYLIEQARKFGCGTYTACRTVGEDSWRFELARSAPDRAFLHNVYRSREKDLELEAATEPASELFVDADEGRSGGRTWSGTVVDVDVDACTVEIRPPEWRHWDDPAPPASGSLFLALSGTRVQLDRRQRARDRIAADRAEMPGLAWLLEGIPVAPPRPRRYDLRSLLTRAVRDCFGGEPTDAQKVALVYAVNTPDIVLVQGPPGTGKTKFIRALQQCLAELSDRTVTHTRVLLTSHQHGAVDNVAGDTTTQEGLPSMRVDSRGRGTRELTKRWVAPILADLDQRLQERPEAEHEARLRRLREHATSYETAPPTPPELVLLIDQVVATAADTLPLDLRERLASLRIETAALADRVASGYELTRRRQAAVVRSLRTTPEAFADDGPEGARQVLQALHGSGLLDADAQTLLKRAAVATWAAVEHTSTDAPADPVDLGDLSSLRTGLLDRLGGSGLAAVTPARDVEVQRLLHEVVDAYASGPTAPGSVVTVEDVLLDYRDDLANDLDYVHRSLPSYSRVIAATCQQVDSQEMFRTLDAPEAVFGTVIIDEAARVSPLDLMIPMTCARDRIALVGDHKQLPHALDLQIEKELDAALDGAPSGGVAADVRRSLFERWYEMFDADPGGQRTIRLDEQFRMHPTLGRFVSRAFYGSPDAITPHPSTKELVHNLLPYQGKVAVWVDVPHRRDEPEIRRRHSFYRPEEAQVLAAELKRLLDLDPERKLSFGAIAFYREQRDEIWRSLRDLDLAKIDEWGQPSLADDRGLERTADDRERLRVGTVDAYQGMEFDVVLLSVTRSNRPGGPARGRYGHLLSENRMCVAMSRQRRLLIAVGDPGMADRRTAPSVDQSGTPVTSPPRSAIEGLVAFRELCETPEGHVVRP